MIVLDTHIWIWWVEGNPKLTAAQAKHLADHESTGLGVSVISCWEIAKLVEKGRLRLPVALITWLQHALAYPGVRLLDLTPAIAVEACELPPPFHSDPADQIIVATARLHGVPLLTADAQILAYPHVTKLP